MRRSIGTLGSTRHVFLVVSMCRTWLREDVSRRFWLSLLRVEFVEP